MADTANDCPSCGMALAAGALSCGSCKAPLGRCPGCKTLLVANTQCIDCEKMAVPLRAKTGTTAVKRKPGPPPPDSDVPYAFEGSPIGLYPLLAVRLVLTLAMAAALLLALVHSGVEVLKPVTERFDPGRKSLPVLWGAFAVFGLLIGGVNTFVRRFRLQHTLIYGAPAAWRPTGFRLVMNLLLNVIFLVLTAGLALPYLYARNRRSFYRNCVVPGHANRVLDFEPSSDEVFLYSFFSLLLLPLVIGSAGLLRPLLSWTWVKWEHNHLSIPGKFGQMQRLRLVGSFWGWFGVSTLGWLITLVSAGLYRPFALAAEWRWIARHTEAVAARPA